MRFVLKWAIPIVVLAWVLAVSAAFALRHGGRPFHANAVVVLEGSKARLPVGLKLVREGYAPLLVISEGDRKTLEASLCAPHQVVVHAHVLCFHADPLSTRGEAEFIGRLAAKRGFSRIDVVTSQFHIFRATIVIQRCYHGALRMVGAPQPFWKLPWYAVTETAKLAYQLVVARSC
jgi:uncharacterized SAM-binding protein YcdF (DUF218 family)